MCSRRQASLHRPSVGCSFPYSDRCAGASELARLKAALIASLQDVCSDGGMHCDDACGLVQGRSFALSFALDRSARASYCLVRESCCGATDRSRDYAHGEASPTDHRWSALAAAGDAHAGAMAPPSALRFRIRVQTQPAESPRNIRMSSLLRDRDRTGGESRASTVASDRTRGSVRHAYRPQLHAALVFHETWRSGGRASAARRCPVDRRS